MKVNREAIYGTQASPFEKLAWGRCTQKKLAGASAVNGFQQHAAWPFEDLRGNPRRPAPPLLLRL